MSGTYEEFLARLQEKSNSFADYLTDCNNANNEVKVKTEKLLKILQKLKKSTVKFCKICYARPPTHVLLPCGHAGFCENCAQRQMNRNKCGICRSPTDSMTRIFV